MNLEIATDRPHTSNSFHGRSHNHRDTPGRNEDDPNSAKQDLDSFLSSAPQTPAPKCGLACVLAKSFRAFVLTE
jgi:hypothetical protein